MYAFDNRCSVGSFTFHECCAYHNHQYHTIAVVATNSNNNSNNNSNKKQTINFEMLMLKNTSTLYGNHFASLKTSEFIRISPKSRNHIWFVVLCVCWLRLPLLCSYIFCFYGLYSNFVHCNIPFRRRKRTTVRRVRASTLHREKERSHASERVQTNSRWST